MPALRAFGRPWRIGSDDFVFPGLSEAFVRFVWVVCGVVVFALHYPLQCDNERDVTNYLSMILLINIVTMMICLAMARISARGSIMDTKPRKHISTLIYLRVPLFINEIVWTCISTVLIFEDYDMCHFVFAVRVAVLLEWALIIFVFIGLLIVFNPLKGEEDLRDDSLISRSSWTFRTFKILKLRQDARMRAALDDIANLIASFFVDDNLVISDIVAGLLLVVHSPINVYPPCIKDEREVPPWMTASAALRFMRLSTCVYGWPTYLMHNFLKPSAYIQLARRIRCCDSIRCDQEEEIVLLNSSQSSENTSKNKENEKKIYSKRVLVVEDNCCLCNTTAFLMSSEQYGMNVFPFFISFRNRLYEVPFVVLFDHDSQSVVVTIRGSCSLSDVVTDLSLRDEVFSADVDSDPVLREDAALDAADGSQVRVHRGMLRSARYVYDTLRNNAVLEDMFVLYPNYSLVVCGHSLGAGVASLLTLFLKQEYPLVKCFAFSPPGCVVSQSGQAEMEQHVMSVVNKDDVIPRITYQSLHKIREAVQAELQQTTRAKCEILIKGIFRLFFSAPWDLHSPQPATSTSASPTTQRNGTDRANLIREGLSGVGYGSQSIAVEMNPSEESRVQLYAPGRILYMATSEEESGGAAESERTIRSEWISHSCLSMVKLSASALTDHLPRNVISNLEKLAEREESQEQPSARQDHSNSAVT